MTLDSVSLHLHGEIRSYQYRIIRIVEAVYSQMSSRTLKLAYYTSLTKQLNMIFVDVEIAMLRFLYVTFKNVHATDFCPQLIHRQLLRNGPWKLCWTVKHGLADQWSTIQYQHGLQMLARCNERSGRRAYYEYLAYSWYLRLRVSPFETTWVNVPPVAHYILRITIMDHQNGETTTTSIAHTFHICDSVPSL